VQLAREKGRESCGDAKRLNAGNKACDALHRFHSKFVDVSAKAGMLMEIPAPFDHICQGAKFSTNSHLMNDTSYFKLHFDSMPDTKELEKRWIRNLRNELDSKEFQQ